MSLVLTVNDFGSHPGDIIQTGSSKTYVNGYNMAHINSLLKTHTYNKETHSNETIISHAATGKTYVNNGEFCAAASGASTSCGDIISASHTEKTYVG